jgi:hypothetical protein
MLTAKQKADEEASIRRVKQWHVDPNLWVNDTFGDKIKLSNQQAHAFTELGKIIQAKIKISQNKELTKEEQWYGKKIGLDISSGMGSGKDFLASLMLFYFLAVFPEENGQSPHVLATANTAKQLSNVLWRQASSIPALSKPLFPDDPNSQTILESLFVCQSEKIYRVERQGRTYFAEAVTVSPHATSDEQSRALTGRHAPYMLMILDEAAGLPEAVFTNLEGTLSGRVNLLLMIYNPIKSKGYVVDARKNDRWLHITWNTEETHFGNPALDIPIQARNKDLLERYGRDSNVYRIRVMGKPPIADQTVFIPWDWIQDSVNREMEVSNDDPVIMGVDPGAGGDNTAIAIRQGRKILGIYRFNTPGLDDFVARVINIWRKYEPVIINIDSIFQGWGTIDRLTALGYRVNPVDVRRTARDRDRYLKVRDELWGTLREQFENGTISIPNDQELIDQLGSIKAKDDYDKRGQIQIQSKKAMKKSDSVGGSPDEADAVCLTYAIPDELLRRVSQLDEDEDLERERKIKKQNVTRNKVTGY